MSQDIGPSHEGIWEAADKDVGTLTEASIRSPNLMTAMAFIDSVWAYVHWLLNLIPGLRMEYYVAVSIPGKCMGLWSAKTRLRRYERVWGLSDRQARAFIKVSIRSPLADRLSFPISLGHHHWLSTAMMIWKKLFWHLSRRNFFAGSNPGVCRILSSRRETFQPWSNVKLLMQARGDANPSHFHKK